MKSLAVGVLLGVVVLVGCEKEPVTLWGPYVTEMELEVDSAFDKETESLSFDFDFPLGDSARKLVGFGNSAYYEPYEGTRKADELLETTQFKGVDLTIPIDWKTLDGLEDRDTPYRLHSFKFITSLIEAYSETQDAKYREASLSWIMDWMKAHPAPFEGSEWAWHGDATGRRVFLLSVVYALWGDYLTENEQQLFTENLSAQVELLTTDEFYSYRHNHGMFQDQAITLYSLVLEVGDRQKELMDLAKTRVLDYFQYTIAADGVHKEHSPSYHYDMVDAVHWFELVYRESDPTFAKEMKALELKMAEYATHVTMPNGITPSIGDTIKQNYAYDGWADNEAYVYASTIGEEGSPAEETMKVFEEGGYGFIRSSWEDTPDEATWMMLTAATHSSAHKHNDDLSFLLYHKGELFVEAGKRDYNYLDPYTRYTYEAYAHNVLFVNDEPYKMGIKLPSINERAKLTRITGFSDEEVVDSVSGSQQRFSGIEQIRTLSYDRSKEVVTVQDTLTSTKKAEGRLLYHLAADIFIKEASDGWELFRDFELVAKVSVSSEQKTSLSAIYGDEDTSSPYKGWIFDGAETPQKGYLLIVDFPIIKGNNEVTFKIKLY